MSNVSSVDVFYRLRWLGAAASLPSAPRPRPRLVAQQFELPFPDWVRTDEHGIKQVNLEHLNAVLVNAVNEQHAEIEAQRARLDAKEAQIQTLEARSAALERAISPPPPSR